MTVSPFERIGRMIEEKEWVKGAVNYDEDLHFSTFYLRASHARNTAPLYPGYTSMVAFFEGFNECYYLLKNECIKTATAVVTKAIQQPPWLPRILRAIKRRSDSLAKVFSPQISPAWLARLSDAAILSLYQKHAVSQRSLYKYARLPEALDRGGLYFTTYLKEYLRKLGLAPSECEASFAILTQPVIPSILAQELLDFEDIVEKARAGKLTLATGSHGRARMFLCPELLLRLQTHLDKWKYLPYHGYGRRDLATLGQYIERLVEHLNQPGEGSSTSTLRQRARQAELDPQEVVTKLGMDRAHQALFSVYPEIGAVKLYRRYAQLRNFYYLDLLLAEIADRIGINEWTLRCMLPEEIVSSLKAGRLADAAVSERSPHFIYGLLPNQECLVTGSEAKALRRLFQAKTSSRRDGQVLKGTVACRGTVVGPCKVIIRADDHRESVSPGSIVVSESTDPDLIGILKNAGGVLTEQGGVTSHAAIICRELGVPTIIGIEGLLDG
jgi:phosphohistidine swiveling domain-containing protein